MTSRVVTRMTIYTITSYKNDPPEMPEEPVSLRQDPTSPQCAYCGLVWCAGAAATVIGRLGLGTDIEIDVQS